MATYILISSNVLTTNTVSYTFTSIPQTYTDLLVKLSLNDGGGSTDRFHLVINNDTGSYYSKQQLQGDGASPTAARTSAQAFLNFGSNSVPATANFFSNDEIYIPNYTLAATHPMRSFAVGERNQIETFINANAGHYNSATAITSLTIESPYNGFDSGSSFYLYGISNA